MLPRCPTALAAVWLLGPLVLPSAAQTPPPAPGGDSQDSERVLQLTLEDTLEIALRRNYDIEIERLATEVARFDAVGSWGAFDPILEIAGSGSESKSEQRNAFAGADVVEDNSLGLSTSLQVPLTTGGSLDLSLDHTNSETNNRFAAFDISTTDVLTAALTQPLLRGAWKRYATTQQRIAEIQLDRQVEREREITAGLALDAYNAYWDLVSAQEELSVRQFAVERGKQQLAQDQRRLEVGAGTEVDVLQSETNVAQQEELRLQAEYAVRQARDTLRSVLGARRQESYEEYLAAWDWPIETLTPLPDPDPELRLDWRSSLRSAFEKRPELAQRRMDIEVSEIDLQRARSERLPRLDLRLATSSSGFDIDPAESFDKAAGWDFPDNSASLTFSMPIWNRTARNAEHAARATVRSSMLAYDRAELQTLAEVRTAVNEVDKQRESVTAAIKSRTLAQRQLDAEETRQQVGLSTTFQVLQFQEDLALAQSTEVAAKASYAKAMARLSFVEGRIADEILALGDGER